MVHFIALYKLKDDLPEGRPEEMIRSSRSQLLKIPEVLNVRSGVRIHEECEWPFFLAIDFENLDKLEMFRDDPVLIKFAQDVIQPNTSDCMECIYEMEPGKDIKYS